MMKKNFKCYSCVYCRECDECLEKKCQEMDYVLYTTEKDKELCDMMCGEVEQKDNEQN